MIIRIAAAVAALLLAAGCSGDSSTAPPTTAASAASESLPAPAPNPVQVATDPCTLLTNADASAHVGAQVTGVPDDLPNVGRGCRWEAPGGLAYLSVILNTPAYPDVSSSTQRTVDIGGKAGSLLADDGFYCLVYVNGGTPWLQFSSQSADTGQEVPSKQECDRSLPLVQKVITNLKW